MGSSVKGTASHTNLSILGHKLPQPWGRSRRHSRGLGGAPKIPQLHSSEQWEARGQLPAARRGFIMAGGARGLAVPRHLHASAGTTQGNPAQGELGSEEQPPAGSLHCWLVPRLWLQAVKTQKHGKCSPSLQAVRGQA